MFLNIGDKVQVNFWEPGMEECRCYNGPGIFNRYLSKEENDNLTLGQPYEEHCAVWLNEVDIEAGQDGLYFPITCVRKEE